MSNQAKPEFSLLAQTIETYYEELRHLIYRHTGDLFLAEEITQETWIRVSGNHTVPHNPHAYIYQIARNLLKDYIRRHHSREKIEVSIDKKTEGVFSWMEEPYTTLDPLRATVAQQELEAVSNAVDELPKRCREVFLLYRGYGFSMREVAELLSISEKTVEKHISRAMLHCRDSIVLAKRNV